jgi:hypothetical protein
MTDTVVLICGLVICSDVIGIGLVLALGWRCRTHMSASPLDKRASR